MRSHAKSLVVLVAVALVTGCVLQNQRQGKAIGPSLDHEWATLSKSSLGDSYCLTRDKENIPIRQITNAAGWLTCLAVAIDVGKQNVNCPIPRGWGPALSAQDKISISKNLSSGVYSLTINHVSGAPDTRQLSFRPSLTEAKYAYAEGKDGQYDYYIYLYDTPQGFDEIWKYYRIEGFAHGSADTCPGERPEYNHVQLWSTAQTQCSLPFAVVHETGEGDGPEGHPKPKAMAPVPSHPNAPSDPSVDVCDP